MAVGEATGVAVLDGMGVKVKVGMLVGVAVAVRMGCILARLTILATWPRVMGLP